MGRNGVQLFNTIIVQSENMEEETTFSICCTALIMLWTSGGMLAAASQAVVPQVALRCPAKCAASTSLTALHVEKTLIRRCSRATGPAL